MRFLLVIFLFHLGFLHAQRVYIVEQPADRWVNRKLFEGFFRHAKEKVQADGTICEFSFVAKEGSRFAGAVVADTFWGALHIKSLYLEPKYRGKGLGKSLLSKILQKGREKGCRFAYVETMSFQAVDFYKKMGFQEEFVRSGYDKNCSYHYFKLAL